MKIIRIGHALNRIKIVAFLSVFAYLYFSVHGCSHSHRRHRGKLSEAMEKASTDYEGDRRISTPEHEYRDPVLIPDVDEQIISVPDRGPDMPDTETEGQKQEDEHGFWYTEESDNDILYSLTGGTGVIKGEDFYEHKHISISVGKYLSENQRLEFFGGIGWAPVQETSDLDNSIEDGIILFVGGINYKYFTTPRYTFLGQYFLLGIALNEMFWHYENPIIVENENRIRSDHITGLELIAGLGVHIAQTKYFQIGAEVLPNIILWDFSTNKGFSNDVFGPFGTIKFRVTFTLMPE